MFEAASEPKRFVAFDGVGHDSYAARHPDAWRAALLDFLAPIFARAGN